MILMSVFNDMSLDEYAISTIQITSHKDSFSQQRRYAVEKQGTPVKVGFRYTLIPNFP